MFFFFGEKIYLKILGKKGPEMGPKRSFSSFMKNKFMEPFLTFWMKLHKLKWFFQEIIVLRFVGKKWLKMRF